MSAYTALTQGIYKASYRDVTTVFFTFAFPLIFLVVFGTIFHGQAVGDTGRSYINYIAPGVLSWAVGNAAVFGVGFTFMQWRDSDLLRLIRMSPTRLTTVLASRFTVVIVVAFIQAVLFVLVAVAFFGLTLAGSWPQAALLILLGAAVFSALGAIIGSLANTPEAVAAVSNFVMLPMAFLSGAFLPLALLPEWLQHASRALPLRYFNDGVAGAFDGRGDAAGLLLNCGLLVAFGAVFTVIAMKVFRWSNQT